jgi:SAM-dependent methyltransferase
MGTLGTVAGVLAAAFVALIVGMQVMIGQRSRAMRGTLVPALPVDGPRTFAPTLGSHCQKLAMTLAIENRYSELAQSGGSLSCGTAIDFAQVQPGQVCVDLGSGRGKDVLRLAERVGAQGHAWGVDLTPAMLEKARDAAAQAGVTNATFVQSSLERLTLPSGCADWVFSNCALNHASDKRAVWAEIARVLKPGARFVVSDLYAVDEISAEYRDDPAAVAECWAGAVLKADYLAQIALAGLSDVHILKESAPYTKGQARIASFTVAGQKSAPT